jgi:hypothetical protein
MFENPGFFAFPMGHGTQAFMVAELLSMLALTLPKGQSADRGDRGGSSSSAPGGVFWEIQQQLARQAERITTNRVIAGVHFPIDSEAGCELGLRLARYLVGLCTNRFTELEGLVPSAGEREGSTPRAKDVWTERPEADPASRDFDYKFHMRVQSIFEGRELTRIRELTTPLATRGTPLQWLWAQAHAEWHGLGLR